MPMSAAPGIVSNRLVSPQRTDIRDPLQPSAASAAMASRMRVDPSMPPRAQQHAPTPGGGNPAVSPGRARGPGPSYARGAASMSARRSGASASDVYLQQITDDLLVEKRSRKAERDQYETALRRLEDRIMQMDDSNLRADTESEKALHMKQRLEKIQEQYEFRKAEVARLQTELRALGSARERERAEGLEEQQAANITIERLTKELTAVQQKLESALRSNVTGSVLEDAAMTLKLDEMLNEFFGLTVCDIPSLEVDDAMRRYTAEAAYEGCFTGSVGVVDADAHLGGDLIEGDVLLRVDGTEIASAQHLQTMLVALCRPDTLLQYRRGSAVRSVRIAAKKMPLVCHIQDVQRLCRLTGGLAGLLADYKAHIFELNGQNDALSGERQALEEQVEAQRQEIVDLRRLLESVAHTREPEADRTMDMQLVGTNAKLSQEKKLLTLRLTRTLEDKTRLEEEVALLKARLAEASGQVDGGVNERLSQDDTIAALTAELRELRDGQAEAAERLKAELLGNFEKERAEAQERIAELEAEKERLQKHYADRLGALQAELDTQKRRHLSTMMTREEWSRPNDEHFEKFDPLVAVKPVEVNPVQLQAHTWEASRANDAPGKPLTVVDVLLQLQPLLSDNVVKQMLPGYGPMEKVMRALDNHHNRHERIASKVELIKDKLKFKLSLLSPTQRGEQYYKEKAAELETECASLRRAADDLMRRLEEGHKSIEALRHAQVELKEASALIARLQHEKAHAERSLAVCQKQQHHLQQQQQRAQQDAAMVSPPRYVPKKPDPDYQEVEVIEHHTKIYVDRSPTCDPCADPVCASPPRTYAPQDALPAYCPPNYAYTPTVRPATGGAFRHGTNTYCAPTPKAIAGPQSQFSVATAKANPGYQPAARGGVYCGPEVTVHSHRSAPSQICQPSATPFYR